MFLESLLVDYNCPNVSRKSAAEIFFNSRQLLRALCGWIGSGRERSGATRRSERYVYGSVYIKIFLGVVLALALCFSNRHVIDLKKTSFYRSSETLCDTL